MPEGFITCPSCKSEIPLDQAIADSIAERLKKATGEVQKKNEAEFAARERKMQAERETLEESRKTFESDVARRVGEEKQKLVAEAQKQAAAQVELRMQDLQNTAKEQAEKLTKARAGELELLKKQRELEDQKQGMQLEMARQVELVRAEAAKREAELVTREKQMQAQREALAEAQKAMEADVVRRVGQEKQKLMLEAQKQAAAQVELRIQDLQNTANEQAEKLTKSREAELELLKKQRELEDQKQGMQLEMARQAETVRKETEEKARKAADEQHQLKEAENNKVIADMRSTIAELQRKADQGSQQLQGEVLELKLERALCDAFRHDRIEPVPKGIHGGDVLMRVRTARGEECGTILWETKRTKNWSDGWLDKLKEDQRSAKAEIAIIVTTALPKDMPHFGCMSEIWITSFDCLLGVATALRAGLLQLAETRRAQAGQREKMADLYHYFIGHEFKQRIGAIVEAYGTMRGELESEKAAMNRIWAKREKQLDRVLSSTAGMHGDLAGIIGGDLPAIGSLDLKALAAGSAE